MSNAPTSTPAFPSPATLANPANPANPATGVPAVENPVSWETRRTAPAGIQDKDPRGRYQPLQRHPAGSAICAWLRQVKAHATGTETPVATWRRIWDERRNGYERTRLVFLGTAPDMSDDLPAYYLRLNGVPDAEVRAALQCVTQAAKFGVVLAMPNKEDALHMVVMMGMADVRRPNDLDNDGTYELLDCVLYPSRGEMEAYLRRRPGSGKLLKGAVIDLSYGQNGNLRPMTPEERVQQLPALLSDEVMATHGGPEELLAYQAQNIGPILTRRIGSTEFKRLGHEIRETAGTVGQAIAAARVGKGLILYSPEPPDVLEQKYPLLTYLLGNLAMQQATDEIEVEEGK